MCKKTRTHSSALNSCAFAKQKGDHMNHHFPLDTLDNLCGFTVTPGLPSSLFPLWIGS